ncbi:MAG TPA: hypothetical protein VK835_05465 [Bacteroidia bacterium]|nr:hypothetical protein [Bacteroidia bacterium]
MNSLLESIKYPQYRRYKNGLSYFKILSPVLCEEIKVVGSKRFNYTIEAKQYPEKVFINDLLLNFDLFADEVSEADYEAQKTN